MVIGDNSGSECRGDVQDFQIEGGGGGGAKVCACSAHHECSFAKSFIMAAGSRARWSAFKALGF